MLPSSNFLSLPAEVRYMVYGVALVREHGSFVITASTHEDFERLHYHPPSTKLYDVNFSTRWVKLKVFGSTKKLALGLLSASRAVSTEVAYFLYGKNKFSFGTWSELSYFIWMCGTQNSRHITSIELPFPVDQKTPKPTIRKRGNYLEWAMDVHPTFDLMTNLRSIRLRVEDTLLERGWKESQKWLAEIPRGYSVEIGGGAVRSKRSMTRRVKIENIIAEDLRNRGWVMSIAPRIGEDLCWLKPLAELHPRQAHLC